MDDNTFLSHRHRYDEEKPRDPYLRLRNWLNIIFMLGALVGVAVFFLTNQTTGTIIILSSMVFKIIECVLRFIK